jgi:hypothetical protein
MTMTTATKRLILMTKPVVRVVMKITLAAVAAEVTAATAAGPKRRMNQTAAK